MTPGRTRQSTRRANLRRRGLEEISLVVPAPQVPEFKAAAKAAVAAFAAAAVDGRHGQEICQAWEAWQAIGGK